MCVSLNLRLQQCLSLAGRDSVCLYCKQQILLTLGRGCVCVGVVEWVGVGVKGGGYMSAHLAPTQEPREWVNPRGMKGAIKTDPCHSLCGLQDSNKQ